MELEGKKVLLGVSGGIAAYKAAELLRRLRDAGAEVQVVMTAGAREFVTPLTFQALSGRPVRTSLWDPAAEAAMGHIELARWADMVLVAPTSADFIARLAQGRADDLLSTLCLATEAPLVLAPAMNHVMWAKAATQENCARLAQRGVRLLGPVAGRLAERESGMGRMLEPDAIVAALRGPAEGPLRGRTVLITAGPTREPIDPVRYISNRSSGRMGYAVAAAAACAGARVILVSGPVSIPPPPGIERVAVATAAEMHAAVMARVGEADVFIGAAAVADYAPVPAGSKIKKDASALALELAPTRDILAEVAALPERPFTVGFCAETDDLTRHALHKLEAKHLDMIAANWVGEGRGFDVERNALSVVWPGGREELPEAGKDQLAQRLIELVGTRLAARQ